MSVPCGSIDRLDRYFSLRYTGKQKVQRRKSVKRFKTFLCACGLLLLSGCSAGVGVIGGADGPTKILLSSGDGVNIWLIVVLIAVFAIGAFIGYRNRNKY